MRVAVQLLPGREPVPPDSTAVVIDVIRATTSLTVAFANGAARVIPAATLDAARDLAAHIPGALLCGERQGRIVPGFDLGNSPPEYTRERVGGRTLVFASTNGAPALVHAAPARERLLASFVNVSAVVGRLERAARVTLVCSGQVGRFAIEDTACAGWIARALRDRGARLEGDAAALAAQLAPASAEDVHALVQGGIGGRDLRRLGGEFARDVEFCAALDSVPQAFALPRG